MSEVWENYINIMLKKADNVPADIAKLYNIKPESTKDLIDQAHPEKVIILPAHDKVNGLLENIKERHDIMVGIVNKPPRGINTHHIYTKAQEDLMNELIKVAFLMDRENQEDLMILADSCANSLVKTSIAWFIPVLIGVGAVALYHALSQNFTFSQGVVQDAGQALTEIQEAIDDYPQLATDLSTLIKNISDLKNLGENVAKIQLATAQEKNPEASAQKVTTLLSNKSDYEIISLLEKYRSACQNMNKILPDYINLIKLKASEYEESHSDWWEPIKKLVRIIVPSDVQDVIIKLEQLSKSTAEAPAQIATQINLLKKMREQATSINGFEEIINGIENKVKEVAPSGPLKLQFK